MKVKVATSQFKAIKGDFDANLNKAISLVEKASNENVDILLLQELFQDYYFCSTKNDKFFDLAIDFPSHPMFEKLSNICKDKKISLPISFFQKKENLQRSRDAIEVGAVQKCANIINYCRS